MEMSMPVERLSIAPRTPEWHAHRAGDVTASAVATALGIDPYRTPLELYAEKTGMLISNADSPLMRRGRIMESVAVEMLREDYPDWEIRYPLDLYVRDPEIRLGATPDALAITDQPGITNIQIKVVAKP